MNHIEYLTSLYDLRNRQVVDVGGGNGSFTQAMSSRGAIACGIEIEADKVAAASRASGAGIAMLEGRGEALPLDDCSQDLVCYVFSFHHVPLDLQASALDEVRRVLKSGGRLHVVDPLASGAMIEVVKLVDDETDVRNVSQARLDELAGEGVFELIAKDEYILTRCYGDFDVFIKTVVSVDPARAARLPSVMSDMEQRFHQLGRGTADGFELDQPCVAYHFALAG